MIKLIHIVLMVIFIVVTTSAIADDKPTQVPLIKSIELDGQTFTQRQIFTASLDTFFSSGRKRPVWLLSYNDAAGPFSSSQNLKQNYPWLAPYLYPENGVAHSLVINKWVKPIRISFDMPNDLRPFIDEAKNLGYSIQMQQLNPDQYKKSKQFKSSPTFRILEEETVRLSRELTDLTGLKIEYLPHVEETTENYAEIRINLVELNRPEKELYKIKKFMGGITMATSGRVWNFRSAIETHLTSSFAFTENSEKQVDGYFLTNSLNEIQMAVCYIWNGHDLPMLKALINECLVRAMGFPNPIQIHAYPSAPVGMLTLWNDPDQWIEKHKEKARLPTALSEFDQYMIRLLYNPIFKSGMDYVEAQKILLGYQ